jgi:hypothetical protein
MKFGSVIVFLVILLPTASKPVAGSQDACKRGKLFTAQGIVAWSALSNSEAFFYKSGLAIDADGAFRAYCRATR